MTVLCDEVGTHFGVYLRPSPNQIVSGHSGIRIKQLLLMNVKVDHDNAYVYSFTFGHWSTTKLIWSVSLGDLLIRIVGSLTAACFL